MCACVCTQAFVCTRVRAGSNCCGLTLMLILDCLRRVCEIAAISISHPPPVPVSPVLCVDVCVAVVSGHRL